jgi:DNA-binding beta-propeller fold protein YncE
MLAKAWAKSSRMRRDFRVRGADSVYETGLGGINGIAVHEKKLAAVYRGNIATIDLQQNTSVLTTIDKNSHFGVAFDPHGAAFVSDAARSVLQVFDRSWSLTREFWEYESLDDEILCRMGGIASTPEGNCWVADPEHHTLKLFTAEGVRIAVIGARRGHLAGEFDCPCGVAVADDGVIYVTDANNCRVQIFDQHRCFLREFGAKVRTITIPKIS